MSERSTIGRSYGSKKLVIANGAAISSTPEGGIIDCRGAAGGMIRVPSAWTAANITFVGLSTPGATGISPVKGPPPVDETAAPIRQQTGGALAKIENIVTNAAAWYPIPPEVLQMGFFMVKSTNTASEADVNQGAERILWVVLKS